MFAQESFNTFNHVNDFTLFTKMMNIASNEYQTRYKDLINLQLV